MKQKRQIILFLIVTLFIQHISFAQTPRINFGMPGIYPEGVAYSDKTKLFYVSSVTTGTIGTVTPTGEYKEWFIDTSLKSTFGIKVDEKNNCLWFCASNPNEKYSKYTDSSTLKKEARIICLDLSSGKKTADIDLSKVYDGKHFLNDITFDDNGNLYITDSYSPVIYKIDKNKTATVFATSPLFKGEDIGLNGIAWYKAGYLITVNNNTGAILKVDVNNPANITKVKIDNLFSGDDGIMFAAGNHLFIVQNKGVNKVSELVSADNWQSAKIVSATSSEDRFAQPSSIAMMNNKTYILNSKLNELMDPTVPKSKDFSIQMAVVKPL